MAEVYIIDATRTPVGKRGGALKEMHPVALAAAALRETVRRAKLDPSVIDDVIMGCVSQVNEQGFNVARNAALLAGESGGH